MSCDPFKSLIISMKIHEVNANPSPRDHFWPTEPGNATDASFGKWQNGKGTLGKCKTVDF